MNLGTLKPPDGSKRKRKRVGRGNGSGHGGTACKGHKGQNARSGGKVRSGFEGGQMPLSRRLPKRGFRNPFRKDIVAINIDQLKKFPAGSVIDEEALVRSGVVNNKRDGIKVLGKVSIDYPVTLKMNMISRGAREKIEAAGGSIIEVI
jgi:large subunit ribosomal protein L15